jgi:DNA (cytosine-5)-methyltransferase 1
MGKALLDLFCCAGGAGTGYYRAGFEVFGVDIDAQPRYPFWFHRGDALDVLRRLARGNGVTFTRKRNGVIETQVMYLLDFDAIHASPPCQGYTRGNAGKETKWPKLIAPVRELLIAAGLPYVIENVAGAREELVGPVGLCGCMFGLSARDTDGLKLHLQRLRLFEASFPLVAPRACDHSSHEWVAGAYGGARRDKYEAKFIRKGGYVPREKRVVQELLGIEYEMTWSNLFESIPPAYTEWVGSTLAGVKR